MTEVVNMKTHDRTDHDVYIGRGSKWGNPFKIGKDGDRTEVIRKYREYLANEPDLLDALHELDGRCLVCFCKPLACHGDVLLEQLNLKKLFD